MNLFFLYIILGCNFSLNLNFKILLIIRFGTTLNRNNVFIFCCLKLDMKIVFTLCLFVEDAYDKFFSKQNIKISFPFPTKVKSF